MQVFSRDDIIKLRFYAGEGLPGTAIAKLLGRTPLSIRVKACSLGIPLRPKRRKLDRLRIMIEPAIAARLDHHARMRGMNVPTLCRFLLNIVVNDNLFAAVIDTPIDDQPVPRKARKVDGR